MRRVSKKVFLITLIALVAMVGVPLTIGGQGRDFVSMGPSQEQIDELDKQIGYVVSHIDQIVARLSQNDTFKDLLQGRDWEVRKQLDDSTPIVFFSKDNENRYVYDVFIRILDGEGKTVRLATIFLNQNLEIKEIVDYPLMSVPLAKLK